MQIGHCGCLGEQGRSQHISPKHIPAPGEGKGLNWKDIPSQEHQLEVLLTCLPPLPPCASSHLAGVFSTFLRLLGTSLGLGWTQEQESSGGMLRQLKNEPPGSERSF